MQTKDRRSISNNVYRIRAFRWSLLSPVRENAKEKIGYKRFQPFCSYFWRMPLRLLILAQSKQLFIRLVFIGLQSFENKKWRSCYRLTTTGLREWAGGSFMEPCRLPGLYTLFGLLYTVKDSADVFPYYSIIMCDYQSFKWNSCSHAILMRN